VTPEQIQVVIHSIEELRPRSEEFARRFYEGLFALDPDARELFPDDMTLQRQKLFRELDEIAHAIPDLQRFVDRATQLGLEHVDFGVEPKHYRAFGTVLMSVLADVYGDDFTPELRDAWDMAYRLVADSMQRGALHM
jgi:hemoglobin-like flavoprotein